MTTKPAHLTMQATDCHLRLTVPSQILHSNRLLHVQKPSYEQARVSTNSRLSSLLPIYWLQPDSCSVNLLYIGTCTIFYCMTYTPSLNDINNIVKMLPFVPCEATDAESVIKHYFNRVLEVDYGMLIKSLQLFVGWRFQLWRHGCRIGCFVKLAILPRCHPENNL